MNARTRAALAATKASADAVNEALQQYVSSVEGGKGKAVRLTALSIVSQAQKATPVDTGRARAGWSVGVRAAGGTPTIGRRKSVDPLAVAQGEASGFGQMIDNENQTTFIAVNGVRYTPYLEAGYSDQAPYGFLRQIMDRHADKLLEAVRNIRTKGTQ